jgi:hypothetical protein
MSVKDESDTRETREKWTSSFGHDAENGVLSRSTRLHTQRLRPDLPKELDHTVHVTANKSATRWVKHDAQVAEVKQHGESRRFTEELMLGALGATCRADDSRWRSPGSKTPACIITKVLFKDIRKNR